MADFMSNFNPFPRQHLGMGATWSSREQLESITRAANMTLASSNGAAISRTPSGPILDIYGLRTVRIYQTGGQWEFYLNPGGITDDIFNLPNGIFEQYKIPHITTDRDFDIFLVKRHSDYSYSPALGGGQIMLCSNNTDFSGTQNLAAMYYANFTRSELETLVENPSSPVLYLGSCTADTDNVLTYTQKSSPYFIHAWCMSSMFLADTFFSWESWAANARRFTQFSINVMRADAENIVSVSSPQYTTAQDSTLKYDHASNTLDFQSQGFPIAVVKINSQGRMLSFRPVSAITVPSTAAESDSFTFVTGVTGAGISVTTETKNTKRGIIQ